MNKVEAKKCERIKANLTFKTPTSESSIFHTDYPDMKTAVFISILTMGIQNLKVVLE
jgi:hypothetical protein